MIKKQVAFNSEDYWKLVDLREEILRKPLGLKFSEEELQKEDNQLHFGLFDKEQALACMVLVPNKNKTIKMRQVCVANNLQGKAFGSELLKYCEDYARSKNYYKIYCHAREKACSFYLKNNYKIEGKEFLEVGIKHFYMYKML